MQEEISFKILRKTFDKSDEMCDNSTIGAVPFGGTAVMGYRRKINVLYYIGVKKHESFQKNNIPPAGGFHRAGERGRCLC